MLNQKTNAIRLFDNALLESPSPGTPLALLLRQLAGLVQDLSDSHYTQKPVGVVESSIAAHVRHCLDHVVALMNGIETGRLDYDRRKRGTDIETSRPAALKSMRNLESQISTLTLEDLDRPVIVSVLMATGQPPTLVYSSVGRELAFVLSHTIHHNALVGAMVKTLGGRLPERFGYAPSTVAHLERQRQQSPEATCAH